MIIIVLIVFITEKDLSGSDICAFAVKAHILFLK